MWLCQQASIHLSKVDLQNVVLLISAGLWIDKPEDILSFESQPIKKTKS